MICYSCGNALYCKRGYLMCLDMGCRQYQIKQYIKEKESV